MPTPSERYNEILNETRNRILDRVRQGLTDELRQIIAEELQQAREQFQRSTRFRPRRVYDRALRRIEQRVTDRILEEQRQAAEEEAGAHEEAALAALALLGAGATTTALAGVSGPLWGAQDGDLSVAPPSDVGQSETSVRALVRSSIEDVAQDVDDILRAVDGDNVDLNPDLEELLDGVDTGEPTEVADAVAGAVAGEDLEDALRRVGMDVDARGGKLENNLRRILSHEVSNAADDADKRLAAQNGAVDLVEWTLSFRHSTLESSPDVCDVLAQADPHGFGPGLYHPERVPILPHPHCECRIEVVLVEPDEWPADREVPERPDAGDIPVEQIMQQTEGERTVTEAHVSNQSDMIDRAFRLTYEEQ